MQILTGIAKSMASDCRLADILTANVSGLHIMRQEEPLLRSRQQRILTLSETEIPKGFISLSFRGKVSKYGSQFSNNSASGGPGGKNHFGGPVVPGIGGAYGGAIFVHSGDASESDNIYQDNYADTLSPDVHILED